MGDEQLTFSSNSRWNSLLDEIPSQVKEKKSAVVEKPAPPPEPEVEEEEKVFTVSEINKGIKKTLEGQFSHLWIQGEISNFKAHTSGHHYFSLKDEKAQISAVMFRGFNSKLKFKPESGMEVLVRGKITVYEPRGNYQVFCEHMEPVGAGALQKAFEQLKEKLRKEGLFDESKKQELPHFPQKIGVVTSPTGAAIRDILNVLGRRCKRAQVTVIPARVQGDVAAAEVVRGIEWANQLGDFDVLIVGRGGGSIEDLWCFNEEPVARAIFASKIPVISAVGHEVDFTIADFVADRRAPTPSAAAEIVAKSESELIERLKFYSRTLRTVMYQKIGDEKKHLRLLHRGLLDPRKYLQDCVLRCDDWSQRLIQSMKRLIQTKSMRVEVQKNKLKSPVELIKQARQKSESLEKLLITKMHQKLVNQSSRFQGLTGMLDSLSPLKVIERGYAIARSGKKLVRSISQVKKGENLQVQVSDGLIEAKISDVKKKGGDL